MPISFLSNQIFSNKDIGKYDSQILMQTKYTNLQNKNLVELILCIILYMVTYYQYIEIWGPIFW